MRLVVMGTGPFAVPMLERLYATRHEVLLLVTRPARPVHGKSDAEANPMRELATARGTPVFDPADINAPEARECLSALAADLLVVCDYGQILSPETLAVARHGGINLHGSLLPKYRGAAPVAWAIWHGETHTGVTVIHMTPTLDGGPAIVQVRTPIGEDETAGQLEARLAQLGAPAVLEAIEALERGTARPLAQDASQATRARRLRKSDGAVDWRRSAVEIRNQVRALDPWPKTFTYWRRAPGSAVRLILDRVRAESAPPATAAPGTVVAASGPRLAVATGEGLLVIERVQPAGRRVQSADEFLRGYPVQAGDCWGPEPASV